MFTIITDNLKAVHDTVYNSIFASATFFTLKPVEQITTFGIYFNESGIAEEIAAQFPKYCKAKITKCSFRDHGDFSKPSITRSGIWFDISITLDERTGEANETAQKRRDKVLEIAQQIGLITI